MVALNSSKIDPMKDEIIDVPGNFSTMVSARYAIREGEVPLTTFPASIVYPSYKADWTADDAYTQAVDDAVEELVKWANNDPIIQDLMAKESWDKFDRQFFEEQLTQQMSSILSYNVAGGNLSKYRNDWMDKNVRRTSHLNDLSEDIEREKQNEGGSGEYLYPQLENDCDTMAITQAVILQRAEAGLSEFLPERTPNMDPDDYKCQTTYYICYGRAARRVPTAEEEQEFFDLAKTPEDTGKLQEMLSEYEGEIKKSKLYHAHVMSSDTGGVLEPVDRTYHVPLNEDPIGDFIAGRTIMTDEGKHYDANDRSFSSDDISFDIQAREQVVKDFGRRAKYVENRYDYAEVTDNYLENVARVYQKFEDAAQDPNVMMAAELFGLARTQGLERESFELLQDLLKNYKVRSKIYDLSYSAHAITGPAARASACIPDESYLGVFHNMTGTFLNIDVPLFRSFPMRVYVDGDAYKRIEEGDVDEMNFPIKIDNQTIHDYVTSSVNNSIIVAHNNLEDLKEKEKVLNAAGPDVQNDDVPAVEAAPTGPSVPGG